VKSFINQSIQIVRPELFPPLGHRPGACGYLLSDTVGGRGLRGLTVDRIVSRFMHVRRLAAGPEGSAGSQSQDCSYQYDRIFHGANTWAGF
jgi:hypothetical protein